MMSQYRVKAPVVKVSIGSLDGNRVARILRAGAIVPEGVAEASLADLTHRGLIEKFEIPEIESLEEPHPASPVVLPGGEQPPTPPADAGDGGQGNVTPPPKAGQGSSAEAWRTYAAAVEVEVAGDASRDDVITAVEAAGKPTE